MTRSAVGADSGAATADSDKGGDVIDIHVAKSGGWWLPFFLGAAAGVGGSIVVYRLLREERPKKIEVTT